MPLKASTIFLSIFIMSDDKNKQQQQAQINIELTEEIAEGVYSNLAMIAHSNS